MTLPAKHCADTQSCIKLLRIVCRLKPSCISTLSSELECPSELSTVARDAEAAECAGKAGKSNYLRLPVASSKADKHSLEGQLPAALEFVSGHLLQQHRVLIHCDAGKPVWPTAGACCVTWFPSCAAALSAAEWFHSKCQVPLACVNALLMCDAAVPVSTPLLQCPSQQL